mgnify:CR=1 FL=1
MFKKFKNLFLRAVWFLLPNPSEGVWFYISKLLSIIGSFLHDIYCVFIPAYNGLRNILTDLKIWLVKYFDMVWTLISKHRLMYVVRLLLLIFLLYRPTLIDLDSLYWTLSIGFYFLSNNFFFLSSYVNPFSDWSLSTPFLKILIFLCFFPALYSSKRLKRRLKKKRKILLKDDELYFIFQWAQRFFIFTFYFFICYVAFFLISVILPLLYIYVFDFGFDVNLPVKLVYFTYLKDLKYLSPFLSFFFNCNFIPISFFFILSFKSLYLFTELYLFYFITFILLYLKDFFLDSLLSILLFFFSVIKLYFFLFFKFIKNLFLLFVFFNKVFFSSFKLDFLIDIFKNFLFSDNFFIFLFFIFQSIVTFFLKIFWWLLCLCFLNLNAFLAWILPTSLNEFLQLNFSILLDFILGFFFSFLIKILDFFIPILNLYLKDLSFFGLVSTWYEYLNHGVQRGVLRNSLLNWMFIHLYASIIAFWFLDFDFRVSVKTPPKTPNTLLKEAKRTQDWIPQNMDFLTLQTNETKIYFAMLEISFEHVESLQFIYGDFEYIDEEHDMEDETPDEEEYYDNESEETMKVREIIESDLGFTKRPTKMLEDDPLDSKSGLERHYLSEIVGEPELIYVEEPLKWAFSSLYSPTFEELHFKDSLFSEWVFDPDEDLTFFEFLLLFPFLFFCIYVWFFHRRKKRHYRSYLRFFVSTRRTVFSGWWVEDFLGLPIGEWARYFFDKMRHHTAPDVKFRRVHKFRMYRNRQKIKLMQMEAFHFERLRIKLYRDSLKNWEDFTERSIKFLAPNRKKHYLYSTVRLFKRETREWAMLGDWVKFFWKPEPTPEKTAYFFESLQVSLSHLIDRYVKRRGRKKYRKNLWRTIQHIPGHMSMPYYPKIWYSRFNNTFLFFPNVTTRFNYNYYNYIGWRDNRARWRRYAFTPGNVTDKVFEYNRSLQRRDYNFYKRWQRRRRLMRVFQF